jgi:Putative beta-barrel porin-2, OmpL-like. bbp2
MKSRKRRPFKDSVVIQRCLLVPACLVLWALTCMPIRADELPCAVAPAWTPCQVFAPGPSIADHSGTHDKDFFWILFNTYADEWNRMPLADPNAPPARRLATEVPPVPMTSPPMPFTDWPIGATQVIGGAMPNSVDEGADRRNADWQATRGRAYPDLWLGRCGRQSQHRDSRLWGQCADRRCLYARRRATRSGRGLHRAGSRHGSEGQCRLGFSPRTDVRRKLSYTTALGFFSNQYVNQNRFTGFDMPMAYGEVFVPFVADGLLFRFGRYITLPDIEAQLAPNDYLYTRSITYAVDNYSTTGLNTSLKLNKSWLLQVGIGSGTETFPWNARSISIPGYSGPRDPGAQPSLSGCIQYQTDSGHDAVYLCVDDINNSQWGYNNLNWYGGTYYHKFNEQFHVSVEAYYMFQRGVWNKAYTGPGYADNRPILRHALIRHGESTAGSGLQRRLADLYRRRIWVARVLELSNWDVRQPHSADRVLQRPERPAHRLRDALHRHHDRLEALARSAGRSAS